MQPQKQQQTPVEVEASGMSTDGGGGNGNLLLPKSINDGEIPLLRQLLAEEEKAPPTEPLQISKREQKKITTMPPLPLRGMDAEDLAGESKPPMLTRTSPSHILC